MRYSVALCTYNGRRYITEQLDSILQQSLLPDEIIISDDNSTDGTYEILQDYAHAHPVAHIRILRNEKNVGVIKNFESCLRACGGDFVFLCDQDDVWHKNKIESFHDFIQKENIDPAAIFMAYSDLEVVNESLAKTQSSFLNNTHYQRNATDLQNLVNLLFRNWIPGCSSLLSRGLINLALPFPNELHMHDHWLALLAACYGELTLIDQNLVKYRQHGQNTVGSHAGTLLGKVGSFLQAGIRKKILRLETKITQLHSLISRGEERQLTSKWTSLKAFEHAINKGSPLSATKIINKDGLNPPPASLLAYVALRSLYTKEHP